MFPNFPWSRGQGQGWGVKERAKELLPCGAKWAQHRVGKVPEASRKSVERDFSP